METQRGFIHKPIKLVGPNNFENILKKFIKKSQLLILIE